MKIINNTDYETKDIKKLCLECFKHWGKQQKYYHVVIDYLKSNGRINGWGGYGRSYIRMLLHRENQSPINFVRIFVHEIMHNNGVHHEDMIYFPDNGEWAKDYPLRKKAIKPKIKIDLKEVRKQKAIIKVKEMQTKLKRTQTLLKKWQKKVKYYSSSIVPQTGQ